MKNTSRSGFNYLLQGFSMLMSPGLKRFVFIPLIINTLIFAILFYFSAHYFSHFVVWLDHKIPSWLHWLNWIIWPLFIAISLFIIAYTFILVASIIASPFNVFLAEKVELIQTGKTPNPNDTIWDAIKDVPRALKREVDKILYYLPRAVILLILFLIPGINIIASVLWFIYGCWVMSIQYLDYPMDNHKIPFQEMRKAMRKKTFLSLSFGCTVVVVLMIPVLNFFVIPAAVIGATLMWQDHFSHLNTQKITHDD